MTSAHAKNKSHVVLHKGSILGPLLFGLTINDICISVTDADILLYADETLLLCVGKNSKETEQLLNNELLKVANWLDENNLFINLKKVKLNLFYMDHINNCQNSQR